MKKFMTFAAGTAMFAAPAVAQVADPAADAALPQTETEMPAAGSATQAPDAAAPGAAAATSSTFTDEEISVYAQAAVEIDKMHSDATLDAEARQSGALAVLQQSGLAPERFNEISDASRSDPELAQRVQLAIANAQGQPGA